jgi:hypothetical protein
LIYLIKNSNIGKLSLKTLMKIDQKNIEILKGKEKEAQQQEENLIFKKKSNIISKEEFEKEFKILKKKLMNLI